jgi:isocitrate dehydrogenase
MTMRDVKKNFIISLFLVLILYSSQGSAMTQSKPLIAVADGDGIGPEIMSATLDILSAAGAQLDLQKIEVGEKVYLSGQPAGIHPEAWEVIRKAKAFLKAPITTPQGGGYKSLNVTIRTTLGLYANIRPCVSYSPFVPTKHPELDVVIVRENEEDLYTGIEYRQTPECYHALKMITRPGCERIIRYAFEYALANDRKKVTCFTKDNILKKTDGLFHKIFDEIANEYPEIEHDHWIIDMGTALLADKPELFDVIVMPNLYGDILSDVAAQMSGSVGLVGTANIGEKGAMFEAIHGSAPKMAGKNTANPSGLLLAAVQMLVHIGEPELATRIHNAWLCTLEEGIHTIDIYKEGQSKEKVGTKEFAKAVIARLGQTPQVLKAAHYVGAPKNIQGKLSQKDLSIKKEIVGADIFIESRESVEKIQQKLSKIDGAGLKLTMISNRGVRLWPETPPETNCVDSWRCRFMSEKKGQPVSCQQIALLLQNLTIENMGFDQVQNLCTFDGVPGYTLAQEEQ